MTEETRNKTSIELMQRNEWEILRLFSGLGEENNKRIIKLYAALALFLNFFCKILTNLDSFI